MKPSTDTDLLREAIRRTLVQRSGPSPDARAVAEAAVTTLQKVAKQLGPILGERGVEVLFSRALHLSGKRFTWLVGETGGLVGTVPLSAIQPRLAEQETNRASAASLFLLVTFGELLASLIGRPLTLRLLAPVWVALPEEETNS